MMMSYLQYIPAHLLSLSWGSKGSYSGEVAGNASTTLDVDNDPDIHEFPFTRELKDATDCHWVVAHVTPPSWKQHLRDIGIEQLCDIHDRAYMPIIYGRCTGIEEVAKLKDPFVLEKMPDYRTSLKDEYD
ncbi:hypothetical protein Tco_0620267 [Tanacetum coccineum]